MLLSLCTSPRTPLSFRSPYRSLHRTFMTPSASPPLLLTPPALHALLSEKSSGAVALDATWFMPNLNPPRDALAEFKERRLPGARFWSVDEVATKGESVRGLPHMMPSGEVFAKYAASKGISRDTHVVIYVSKRNSSATAEAYLNNLRHRTHMAPRTAFTFLAFQHPKVSILDGGLPAWIDAKFPVESGEPESIKPAEYPTPTLQSGRIRSYEEMRANVAMGPRGQTVLDARPKGRFDGVAPEPRAGMSSGHMPQSLSLPFSELVSPKTSSSGDTTYTTLKSQTDLWRTIADSVGGSEALDELRQGSSAGESAVTATCGSGMTAAVIWLALKQIGVETAIYDESWMGWAGREDSPIVKTEDEK